MSGGTTMYPGIADRMQKEITARCPIHHQDQDHCSTREEVLRLDRRIYLGLPLHLPTDVDHQARVRRVRPIHCPQEVLLSHTFCFCNVHPWFLQHLYVASYQYQRSNISKPLRAKNK